MRRGFRLMAWLLLGWLSAHAQEVVKSEEELNPMWREIADAAVMRVSSRDGALWAALLKREGGPAALTAALETKPDVNARSRDGHTPLTAAIFVPVDELEKILRLLRAGADPNGTDARGNTPLFYALRSGKFPLARRLIAAGARIERIALDRYSALQVAIRYDRIDEVPALVAAGANLSETVDGWTIAHRAALQGKLALLRTIDGSAALINARGPGGRTPLMSAARQGRVSFVQGALEAGAEPNEADDTGATPLMMTAQWGHLEAAKALLAAGATPRLRNQAGETAYVIAGRRGHRAVQEALLACGAEAEPVWLADEAKRALNLNPGQRRALALAALDLHWAWFSLGDLSPQSGEKERAEQWLKKAGMESERDWRAECKRWRDDEAPAAVAAPVLTEDQIKAKEEELLADPVALAKWRASLKNSASATRAAQVSQYCFLMVLGARAGWINEERAWRALERAEREVAAMNLEWPAIGAAVRSRIGEKRGQSADALRAMEALLLDEKSPTALWRLSPWQ